MQINMDEKFVCNAKKSSCGGRSMGGVVVFVKSCIAKLAKRICPDFEFGVILLFDKTVFKIDKDVLILLVYIPPQNSSFYSTTSVSCFEQLEHLLVKNKLLDYIVTMRRL